MGSLVKDTSVRGKTSPKRPKICTVCEKSFIGFSSNQKTCSPECSRIHDNRRQREI